MEENKEVENTSVFKKLAEKVIKMIDLKTIITLELITALIYFTNKGVVGNETFIMASGAVITFYFTRKDDKKWLIYTKEGKG